MNFKLTLERKDGTWGQIDFNAPDVVAAMRFAARSFDLEGAKTVTLVEVEDE